MRTLDDVMAQLPKDRQDKIYAKLNKPSLSYN